MRHLNRLLAAFVLACALSVSTFAGEISCGRTSEPPDSDETSATVCGDIYCGVAQAAATVIQSLL